MDHIDVGLVDFSQKVGGEYTGWRTVGTDCPVREENAPVSLRGKPQVMNNRHDANTARHRWVAVVTQADGIVQTGSHSIVRRRSICDVAVCRHAAKTTPSATAAAWTMLERAPATMPLRTR
ncbi:MAG: hypothetical protein M3O46_20885, partial [Myxococcota bacterium]|nr:hypothetical protein [Myxococcota bacterium]